MIDKEKPDNRGHAARRRAEAQEAMRERLRGMNLIHEIDKDLQATITREDLPIVEFRTKTRLSLLDKILPSLKAVELTGEDGGAIRVVATSLDEAL